MKTAWQLILCSVAAISAVQVVMFLALFFALPLLGIPSGHQNAAMALTLLPAFGFMLPAYLAYDALEDSF